MKANSNFILKLCQCSQGFLSQHSGLWHGYTTFGYQYISSTNLKKHPHFQKYHQISLISKVSAKSGT